MTENEAVLYLLNRFGVLGGMIAESRRNIEGGDANCDVQNAECSEATHLGATDHPQDSNQAGAAAGSAPALHEEEKDEPES